MYFLNFPIIHTKRRAWMHVFSDLNEEIFISNHMKVEGNGSSDITLRVQGPDLHALEAWRGSRGWSPRKLLALAILKAKRSQLQWVISQLMLMIFFGKICTFLLPSYSVSCALIILWTWVLRGIFQSQEILQKQV